MGMYKNIVAIWSGAIVDIPANWQICDGTNGTLDLRNYFVIGSQGNYAIGEGGGGTVHVHGFTTNGHRHSRDVGSGLAQGTDYDFLSDTVQVTGTTDNQVNLPPYYALAFIMRMS